MRRSLERLPFPTREEQKTSMFGENKGLSNHSMDLEGGYPLNKQLHVITIYFSRILTAFCAAIA